MEYWGYRTVLRNQREPNYTQLHLILFHLHYYFCLVYILGGIGARCVGGKYGHLVQKERYVPANTSHDDEQHAEANCDTKHDTDTDDH